MVNLDKWLREREKKDGKPLEKKYKGKIVAIGPDGETIIGENDTEVAQLAIKKFGSGNFAFKKIGYSYFGKWLNATSK